MNDPRIFVVVFRKQKKVTGSPDRWLKKIIVFETLIKDYQYI